MLPSYNSINSIKCAKTLIFLDISVAVYTLLMSHNISYISALVEINVVCSVCVQLIADICKTEAQSNRLKLSNESLTEFNAFTTKLVVKEAVKLAEICLLQNQFHTS